jgi:hypothetical protein
MGGHICQRVFPEQPSAFVFDVWFRSSDPAKNQDMGGEQFSLKDSVWNLTNKQTKECTAQAFLHVSDDGKFHSSFAKALLVFAL